MKKWVYGLWPAFPVPNPEQGGPPGMDMRDYFAAAAMEILLHAHEPLGSNLDPLADHAYRLADAMLRARENDDD